MNYIYISIGVIIFFIILIYIISKANSDNESGIVSSIAKGFENCCKRIFSR